MRNKFALQKIKRLIVAQAGMTLLLAVLSLSFGGLIAGYSSILGGLVCIIPSMIFANQLFKHRGARSAQKIVNSFYKGEAIKIILSIVLFAIVFIMCNINALAFFITYIVVQMTFWLAPWIIINN